jgi:5-methylcytosine-specific restriction enzyme A
MPNSPPTACRYPSCSEHAVEGGYCSKHKQEQPPPKKYVNAAWRKLYDTSRWRHPTNGLRAVKLRRNPICEDPHKMGCHNPSDTVHHVKDHRGDERLFFDYQNLQAVCKACHDPITGSTHGPNRKAPTPPHIVNGLIANQQ